MRIAIGFDLQLTGLARRLVDLSEDELFQDGVKAASEQSRAEIETNFHEGGRPSWGLTEEGETPLYDTGRLLSACTNDAVVENDEEGFTLSAAEYRREVAEIQDRRYNFFSLPDEAQRAVAEALEVGMLGD